MKPKQKTKQNAPAPRAPWVNRIKRTADVNPADLMGHPLNFRIHSEIQGATLKSALDQVGWIHHVTVNERTGRMVDGHLRVALAMKRGEPTVPVAYVDLSPQEEAVALASGDAIGALGEVDAMRLEALLADVGETGEELVNLWTSLTGDARLASFASVEEAVAAETAKDEKQGSRLGDVDTKAQIKPVIYADQLRVFELALRATGERNRGRALVAVCQAYIDAHPVAGGGDFEQDPTEMVVQ